MGIKGDPVFTENLGVIKNELEGKLDRLKTGLFPFELDIIKVLYCFCPEAYDPLNKKQWDSDSVWTERVKKELLELGNAKGFLVFPDPSKFYGGSEWLFDLVWVVAKYESGGSFDWRQTRGIALACESEWSIQEENILEDFYKLTFVLSELRLFIYTNRTITGKGINTADLCRKVCPLSRGFRYLLVGYPENSNGKFQIDAWIA